MCKEVDERYLHINVGSIMPLRCVIFGDCSWRISISRDKIIMKNV